MAGNLLTSYLARGDMDNMVILRRCCDTEDFSSTNVFVCAMGIGKEGYTFGTDLLAEQSHLYMCHIECHVCVT